MLRFIRFLSIWKGAARHFCACTHFLSWHKSETNSCMHSKKKQKKKQLLKSASSVCLSVCLGSRVWGWGGGGGSHTHKHTPATIYARRQNMPQHTYLCVVCRVVRLHIHSPFWTVLLYVGHLSNRLITSFGWAYNLSVFYVGFIHLLSCNTAFK